MQAFLGLIKKYRFVLRVNKCIHLHDFDINCLSVCNVSSTDVCCKDSNNSVKGACEWFLSKISRTRFSRLCLFGKSVTSSWSLIEKRPAWNISSAILRGSSSMNKYPKWFWRSVLVTVNFGIPLTTAIKKLKKVFL